MKVAIDKDADQPAGEVPCEHDPDIGLDSGASAPGPNGKRAREIANALRPIQSIQARVCGRYLVKRWLDQSAFSVVYGSSNVGKTFLAMDVGLHVASGNEWHGNKVKAGTVVYVAAEGGGGFGNRLEGVRRKRPELVDHKNFHLLPIGLDLCAGSDGEELVNALHHCDIRPNLVIVDTLSRVMGSGDENVARDMGLLVRNLDHVREQLQCHVTLIHHCGKDASRGARGSSALKAAVDTEIELTRDGDVIQATTKKQRDLTSGKAVAFRLEPVEIGHDEDGDVVTSAVVIPVEPVRQQGAMTQNGRILLDALLELKANQGASDPVHRGGGGAGEPYAVKLTAVKERAAEMFAAQNKGRAFQWALKSLKESGFVDDDGTHIWAITDTDQERAN